jgi:hypothetical protein
MKKLRVFLFLIVLLFASLLIWRLVSNWRHVVASQPGQVLYVATFDGFDDEWSLSQGRNLTQIENGMLRISVVTPQTRLWADALPTFGDFDLRVQTAAVSGPTDNAYGVIFRFRDPDNYYLFQVSSDGFYRVARVLNGDLREISTWIRSDMAENGLVNAGFGSTNHLRVVARGDRFRFYINGVLAQLCIPNDSAAQSTYRLGTCIEGSMQDEMLDRSFAVGRIGVMVETRAEAEVVAEFDNVMVLGPE